MNERVRERERIRDEVRAGKRPMGPPVPVPPKPMPRLMPDPNKDHQPESYEDLQLGYHSSLFSALERHLRPEMLTATRDVKANFMRDILKDYWSPQRLERDRWYKTYRERIIRNYQPLHEELYTLNPKAFFVPEFLEAINVNTEQSFRSIMSRPAPGIFTFKMLQPHFCELLLSEVENFKKWVHEAKFRIKRPNIMNKYGAILDDFGLETMLHRLMEDFISPLSKVFFSGIGGSNLDSHHGFIVEYGINRDVDIDLHVDDSEVTLNVCLSKEFLGGELFFRGMRCDKHLTTATYSDEIYDYPHVTGQAVLHHGRIRHGAKATTSGRRVNLLLWCRSSRFRVEKMLRKDCSSWCGVCNQEKEDSKRSLERQLEALLRKGGETTP
ncbi:2-oxoglutarate and iron-dependent oxygenase domain-containing protein CP2-like [Lotus japonicus]|uniref:2-oxoglutarate and iron-dependent oxygenase domain-containing protein CP2-like n=1 Tax=Lotus japonicus TaxID=34305 RepID=UPI002589A659|nr:2-oxoglutarate and iron-dependent oxygenase domain-containing protein CP2-like [Lotus japonicus]